MDYAIYMLDTQGNIPSWSAGGRRIKGYPENEILGQHSRFYIPRTSPRATGHQRLASVGTPFNLCRCDILERLWCENHLTAVIFSFIEGFVALGSISQAKTVRNDDLWLDNSVADVFEQLRH